MFKKNYVFVGYQEGNTRPFVMCKWKISKKDLRKFLTYMKCYYNCYAIEYYTVKRKDWYK